MNDTLIKNLVMFPVFFIVMLVMGLCFAWVPMLGWNLGLHSVYPEVFPKITYWQAFWIAVLLGWVTNRPVVKAVKNEGE